jgi:hypothetical protein
MTTTTPHTIELPPWLDRDWLERVVPAELRDEIDRAANALAPIARALAGIGAVELIRRVEHALADVYGRTDSDELAEIVWEAIGLTRVWSRLELIRALADVDAKRTLTEAEVEADIAGGHRHGTTTPDRELVVVHRCTSTPRTLAGYWHPSLCAWSARCDCGDQLWITPAQLGEDGVVHQP